MLTAEQASMAPIRQHYWKWAYLFTSDNSGLRIESSVARPNWLTARRLSLGLSPLLLPPQQVPLYADG